MGITQSIEQTKSNIRKSVQDEVTRRLMIQREVQMAVNVARARDNLHIFGSLWLTLVSGVSIAQLLKKPVPPIAGVPIVVGGIFLGNLADMAYGNKLARINKEAEHLLQNERARFVPFPQAPFSKFYSPDERAIFYDQATAVGDLAPWSLVSRSVFVPKST